MKKYESMVIFKPDLTEQNIEAENQKIADIINKAKGNIIETDFIGKRNLAYPVAKCSEGHFLINYLNLPPENVGKIESYYRLNESIIRYNILRKEDKKEVS